MNPRRFIFESLRHYRRSHLAVALGVAVATAVMTGALLVGDSVRGSLHDLVLERLGAIDQVLLGQLPFRATLAEELAAAPGFKERFGVSTPALLLQATLSHRAAGLTRRASDVTLLGVTEAFGRMNTHGPDLEEAWDIPADEVWLTVAVATDLGVAAGDEVLVRLPAVEAIPSDSPLGEKSDTTIGRRMNVGRVLADEGLARFTLAPSQRPPRNAFVSLRAAQRAIDLPGKANLLLVGWQTEAQDAGQWLRESLRPSLMDYGLSVELLQDSKALQIESRQLVLSEPVVRAADEAFGSASLQPVITYLANTLKHGDKQVAYSTVSGVDSTAELGPLLDESGQPLLLSDNEIVLNGWAADALGASVGDTITVTYYEPESTHGKLTEAKPLELRLKAIVELATTDGRPTRAADPRLTPVMEGVTDADSIDDWDMPFELVEPITAADEDYWDEHSTTPKAFVSLDLAKKLWSTRWGSVSLLRLPVSPEKPLTADEAAAKLRDAIDPADLGLAFQPIKQLGLAAASGTTPFDGLFFGFSLFLIASAVMLIALLYRLGIDGRAREVGLLTATGWTPRQVRRLLTSEGLLVAAVGAAVGVAGGVGYAWLMLAGLRTLWVEAIVTPFLTLHIRPMSLLIGFVIGVLVTWLTIAWSLRGLAKVSPRSLLAGETVDPLAKPRSAKQWRWLTLVVFAAAIGLSLGGAQQQGEAQAGLFFGAGALMLLALIMRTRAWLLNRSIRTAAPNPFGLGALATRNIARNPGRSLLTIALVAAASFLILAISAFRLPPTTAGTGGYDWVAQTDQPLHFDLNTPAGRDEYGFPEERQRLLRRCQVDALRVYDGEDASCLNLYQTSQPRVLGVPSKVLHGFSWAAPTPTRLKSLEPGFHLLEQELGKDKDGRPIVPVILDFNTAMYSLKLYASVGAQFTIRDATRRPVTLQVVGLLKNSMLQGDLLISEANFLRLFPDEGGYRFFLIRKHVEMNLPDDFPAMLEDQLSDYGLDVEDAKERLAGFLAVQNTYLSTFQSLGALGLLLGAVGVAVVQLRNVAQRRGELALLRAAGFSHGRLARLVLIENLLLLLGGLAIGALAALVALAPQTLIHETSLPWASTALLLAAIALVGVAVGWLATRSTLDTPLLPALRGE